MQKFNLKDFWLSLGLVVIQHFPFFFNRYPLNGDDLEFGLAFTRVFYQQVESFSWGVSSLNGSFPLIAEGQIGFFHPLRWLVYLLPPWPDSSDVLAIAGEYVFLLILANLIMCYGMMSLLRLKGCRGWAVWIPTLIFCNYGFHQSQSTNINLVLSSAILPWIIILIDEIFENISKRKFPKKEIFWLVLALVSSFLAGQIQGSLIIIFIAFVYLFVFRGPFFKRLFLIFSSCIFISFLVAIPQIFATFSLSGTSVRENFFWGTQGGIDLKTVLNGFFPLLGLDDIASYDPVASSYLSILFPIFLLYLFFNFKSSSIRNIYLFGILLSLFFSWGPGYGMLVKIIPFLGLFRDFHRFMLGVLFFFCLYIAELLKRNHFKFNPKQAIFSFFFFFLVFIFMQGSEDTQNFFFDWSRFTFFKFSLNLVLPLIFLLILVMKNKQKNLHLYLGIFLILETFIGIFWRWNVRFYEYFPENEISFISNSDCPEVGTSVWFIDTYSENLKQESIDMKKPFAAYVGSPNGYLWDDPIFSNCAYKPVRFQLNSPLQSVWAVEFQDFFIPSTGLEDPTISDLIKLSEIWSRTKLDIEFSPEEHFIAGEIFYRYKREILEPKETFFFSEDKLIQSSEDNRVILLSKLFTSNLNDFIDISYDGFSEGVVFNSIWWYPGWSSNPAGKELPRMGHAFLGLPKSLGTYEYVLPGYPYVFYLSLSTLLLFCLFLFFKI